ncbi:MAG: diguanylate cyclase [Sulfuritalea sp.]|nr:diguanylate cyclase [Sulfuritalea sp.]MDP1983428.1 diguanylate cyclase [Sulfuritalea sp.]
MRQTVAGREKEIGTLEVVADVDAIYRQVAGLALAIVLGNAIKTFLVALFMVALFRRLVSGRLEALAGKVRQRLAAVSPAPGIAAPLAPPGELAAAVAGMRELNAALAQQVAEKDAALRQREAAEKKIKFIAFHDSLTGLPNQQLALDRFGQAVAYAEREHSKVGLLFIDLDNFKTVNDSLGHAVGDGLIREVAARLHDCVRDTDTISRRGGDEFLIILPDLPEPDATAPILVKLMERLIEPMTIAGHELQTTASVGVAIYPDDGRDLDTLMKKAETAMYRAKDAGRNTYRFFDARMNVEAIEQLRLRNGLRRALERGEFVLHYQPQIDLATDNLVGVEALIRWNHPELGMILPDRFIPIAEESGLIVPISEWVLREACRQAVGWAKAGMAGVVVAVNISGVHFRRGDLEQSIIAALEESGLDAAMLELELTESILISHSEGVLETVGRLSAPPLPHGDKLGGDHVHAAHMIDEPLADRRVEPVAQRGDVAPVVPALDASRDVGQHRVMFALVHGIDRKPGLLHDLFLVGKVADGVPLQLVEQGVDSLRRAAVDQVEQLAAQGGEFFVVAVH